LFIVPAFLRDGAAYYAACQNQMRDFGRTLHGHPILRHCEDGCEIPASIVPSAGVTRKDLAEDTERCGSAN